MTDRYRLDGIELPTIPVPHDGEIEQIYVKDNELVFEFKNSEANASIFNILKPGMQSLTIKYHMTNKDDFCIYKYFKPSKLLHRNHGYKYVEQKYLSKLSGLNLEYLYHNIGYRSVIIQLYADVSVVLEVELDYIEFEWA